MTTFYIDRAKTIASVNGTTYSPGDFVLFERGGTWRETLVPKSSGAAGAPITFGAYGDGPLPKILGSTPVSPWASAGGGVWSAPCSSDPISIWFVEAGGALAWGHEVSGKAACIKDYDWSWVAADGKLYIYPASDPNAPNASIERPVRQSGVYSNAKAYITIQDLDVAFCYQGSDARAIWTNFAPNNIVEYCELHHNGDMTGEQGNGTYCYASDKIILRHNTAYENARRGMSIFSGSGYVTDPLIEHNVSYNNYHSQMDVFGHAVSTQYISGLICRYNHFYTDAGYGAHGNGPRACQTMLMKGDGNYIIGAKVYYNIFERNYNTFGLGLEYCNGIEIYNNVFRGTAAGASSSPGLYATNTSNSNIKIKNNIGLDCKGGCLKIYAPANVTACDNNLWHQSAGGSEVYVYAGGASYHYNDQASYRAATGWDAHGLWEDPRLGPDLRELPDSPCIGDGVDVGLTADRDGTLIVDNPDIGAYEYQEDNVAIKKTIPFTLEVTAAPDFFPEIVPSSLSVAKGVVAVYRVSFTAQGGFTGPVSLAVVGLPAGATAAFDKPSINLGQESVLSIQTTGAALGSYPLTVEATANL